MGIESFLHLLGDEVQAPDEETFALFAQQLPSQNLGFIDSKAKTIDLTVAGRDLIIHQSPGILSSSRAGGTTGAVVWKITPLFTEWISSPANPLFAHGILTSESSVIELGCGIAGIVALLLAPQISTYVLTDQVYVAKLLEENIAENTPNSNSPSVFSSSSSSSSKRSHHPKPKQRTSKPSKSSTAGTSTTGGVGPKGKGIIRFATLDWEEDEPSPELLTSSTLLFPSAAAATATPTESKSKTFDAIIACDCIYNEALIEPLVSTFVDICKLKSKSKLRPGEEEEKEATGKECIVIVAQQLRDPSVFESFMTSFVESFQVWRVPDSLFSESVKGLRSNSGFVVHVGVLKKGC